jgi:hypothetical protein
VVCAVVADSDISGDTTEDEEERDDEGEVVDHAGEGEIDWGRARSNSSSPPSSGSTLFTSTTH